MASAIFRDIAGHSRSCKGVRVPHELAFSICSLSISPRITSNGEEVLAIGSAAGFAYGGDSRAFQPCKHPGISFEQLDLGIID
jgi:hypothetical protein